MHNLGPIPSMVLDDAQPHFDDNFVYAGTAAFTMLTKLLSEAERERIIGSQSVETLVDVLRETVFGIHIANSDTVYECLNRAMIHAKHELTRISPNPHLLNMLWLRYDFYNLKTLLKRKSEDYHNATEADIVPFGLHSFATLERAVETGNGASLHNALSATLKSVPKDPTQLDHYMEVKYFEAALEEAKLSEKAFALRYIRLHINLFAILTGVRAYARGETPMYITWSDVSTKEYANVENLFARLSRIGFSRHWNTAIEKYRETNNFSELDRAADDYIMKWLKRQSITLHSPAPLFAYWHILRENVQLIRASFTAKQINMDEKTLREIIRTSYNTYAY